MKIIEYQGCWQPLHIPKQCKIPLLPFLQQPKMVTTAACHEVLVILRRLDCFCCPHANGLRNFNIRGMSHFTYGENKGIKANTWASMSVEEIGNMIMGTVVSWIVTAYFEKYPEKLPRQLNLNIQSWKIWGTMPQNKEQKLNLDSTCPINSVHCLCVTQKLCLSGHVAF